MRSIRAAWFVGVNLMLCSAGFGQLVQWKATGTIEILTPADTSPDWLPDAALGQRFEISFVTDLEKPALFRDSQAALYSTSNGYAKVGSRSWIFDESSSLVIITTPGNFALYFNSNVASENLQFQLLLNTRNHIGSLDLPLSLPPIEDFDLLRSLIVGSNAGPLAAVQAHIDSFSLTVINATPVPEPSTYGVLATFAVLGLAVRRRLKR